MTALSSSLRRALRSLLPFIVLQLSSLFVHASGEIIYGADNSSTTKTSMSGNVCQRLLFDVVVPFDGGHGGISKVDWYANGSFVLTVSGGNNFATLTVSANPFAVTCVVTYADGTTGSAPAFNVEVDDVLLNIISGNTSINLGCANPEAYSTSIADLSLYKPASNIITYNWSFPPGWTITSGAGTPNVSVIPDPTSSGTIGVSATITTCGYTNHPTTIAVSRISPQVSFPAGNPLTLCDNSTATIAIAPTCGPSTFTYTLSGNSAATFQANGAQSLTTSATSVTIATGSLAGAATTLSVAANYPGASSSPIFTNLSSGAPSASLIKVVSQGPPWCPNVPISFGVTYNGNCTNLLNQGITNVTWWVAPTPNQIINNSGMARCGFGNNAGVQIQFNPSPTMYNVAASATNACGTSALCTPLVVTLGTPGVNCPIRSSSDGDPTSDDAGNAFRAGADASGFVIAPNPSTGRVLVSLPGAGSSDAAAGAKPGVIRQIDVYNTTGTRLRSFPYGAGVTGSTTIDLGGQADGVYILVITTDKGKYNKKIALIK